MPLSALAKIAIQVGIVGANMALTMSRKIEGPRLDDLKFTGGDYGAALNLVWGGRRLACPIFHGEPLREIKRQRKTKGGKYNEYTYYGTFAFALADGEMAAVRRIWFDKHLVLDLSGEGPVTPFDFGGTSTGKGASGAGAGAWLESDYFAVYLGTETQEPDPRMMSYIEAQHGEGSCPAYRGLAYVMVKDLPLEKFGNRIPQIEAEVLSASAGLFPLETVDLDIYTGGGLYSTFSPDYSVLLVHGLGGAGAGEARIFDTAARASIVHHTGLDFGVSSSQKGGAISTDGTFYAMNGLGTGAYSVNVDGVITGYPVRSFANRSAWVKLDRNGEEHWLTAYVSSSFTVDDAENTTTSITGASVEAHSFFRDRDGDIWLLCGDSSWVYFVRLGIGGATQIIEQVASPGPSGVQRFAAHYRDDTRDQFVFTWDSEVHIFDRTTGTITASSSAYPNLTARQPWDGLPDGSASIWLGFNEVSLADLSLVRSFNSSQWGVSAGVTDVFYDPVNHALVQLPSSGTTVRWFYLDRVATSTVTLSSIMGDLADRVAIEAADYDFSALDQVIEGYSATQGQASAMAEPLLDAYDSDIRPHEFGVQGIKRTGTASGSQLTTTRMARDGSSPRYVATVQPASELPRAVTINFADIDADQQPNNARADRPQDASDARGEQTIDLTTLVLDADSAGQLARRYFRRKVNDRRGYSFGVTTQQLALEPGDVRSVELDGATVSARAIRTLVRTSGVLSTEWKYDHPQLALLDGAAGAGFDGRTPDTITVPLLSKGFFLDIPMLTDADDQVTPALYVAAAPYAAGAWPGAVMFQETGGEYTNEIASVPSGSIATWGYATDVLADANPNIWDRGNSVNVTLQNGTLTGATEAALDADTTLNLAIIGGEIVQFTTATLEMDGSYTLSGFKRGRRGTEWACDSHAVGEAFLLLDTAQDVAMGLSEVGTNLSFKAITSGRTTGFQIDLEPFSGASLKPYAPCHLCSVKDAGTGDWTLTWVRRTRIGGAWTSGTSIPLSEASEEYEVEILNGSTVVRTITALSSPTTTYTAAQQTTDFGSTQTSLDWRVYQISAAVDRGFAAAA